MTHRLIRHMAKEIAGKYFEEETRTERFRKELGNSDRQQLAYVNGHWPHFIDLAKEALGRLLNQPTYPQYLKDTIHEALVDDFSRGQNANAMEVIQAKLDKPEKEDRRFIDENLHRPTVGD